MLVDLRIHGLAEANAIDRAPTLRLGPSSTAPRVKGPKLIFDTGTQGVVEQFENRVAILTLRIKTGV